MTRETENDIELVVVFQDPTSRRWVPVGRLSYADGLYSFQYTQGAVKAHDAGIFLPFGVMRDFADVYRSELLFPLFQNRIMPHRRPKHADYVRWLRGTSGELSPIEELGMSGGARATDSIQLYPVPKNIDGYYRMSFFSHGVRHLPQAAQDVIDKMNEGTRLYLMKDFQNSHDPEALALRTTDPIVVVGYCPRFLCPDFEEVSRNDPAAEVTLAQANLDAPTQFRYRCELKARWPEGFEPFNTPGFRKVVAADLTV